MSRMTIKPVRTTLVAVLMSGAAFLSNTALAADMADSYGGGFTWSGLYFGEPAAATDQSLRL